MKTLGIHHVDQQSSEVKNNMEMIISFIINMALTGSLNKRFVGPKKGPRIWDKKKSYDTMMAC